MLVFMSLIFDEGLVVIDLCCSAPQHGWLSTTTERAGEFQKNDYVRDPLGVEISTGLTSYDT